MKSEEVITPLTVDKIQVDKAFSSPLRGDWGVLNLEP